MLYERKDGHGTAARYIENAKAQQKNIYVRILSSSLLSLPFFLSRSREQDGKEYEGKTGNGNSNDTEIGTFLP